MTYKCEKVISDINRTVTVDDIVYDVYTGEIVEYKNSKIITNRTYDSGIPVIWDDTVREFIYTKMRF